MFKVQKILKIRLFSHLQRIMLSMVLGLLFGLYLKEDAAYLEYLGIMFLNLIRMISIPLIFFTIVYGITNVENNTGLLRISRKAVIVFLATSLLAVAIGLVTALLIQPGIGVSPELLKDNMMDEEIKRKTPTEVLLQLIPTNIFKALVEGNILQVLVFGFFIGFTMNSKKETCKDIIEIIHQAAHLFFEMMHKIMHLAPIGVFGYIAAMVGVEGIAILFILGKLLFAVILASIVQYLVFGLLIVLGARVSPIPFYKKMIAAQVIAFSTSSSKATLVHLMKIAETKLGISSKSSKFVLPLSAALNMDGGAIYQSICAIFFSQMMGIDLHFAEYATLFLMCTLASIGGAGIPGGVLIFLGMVLQSVGLPVEGVLVIASIDRILDMFTTTINITGDACVTLLIDSSEGTLNKQIYYAKDTIEQAVQQTSEKNPVEDNKDKK